MDADSYFVECLQIARELNKFSSEEGGLEEVRKKVITLLSEMQEDGLKPDGLVNALCRQVGLYPYIDDDTACWDDLLAKNCFAVSCNEGKVEFLHIWQSKVLKRLLNGKNVALSAPTSFGKSFIIDVFIRLRKPKNVVVIVPTIALMDETRRRLIRKFSSEYKIITLPNENIEEKNIFVFPQERLFYYINQLASIDLLVVDEFYKAANKGNDDTRQSYLQKAILAASKKSKQVYYLMPNIHALDNHTPFTENIECIESDFSPVVLKYHPLYNNRKKEQNVLEFKLKALMEIFNSGGKTLVYAGHISEIKKICEGMKLSGDSAHPANPLLLSFADWLDHNYGEAFPLIAMIKNRVGSHNGKLHRSLCQLQVRLFELDEGLDMLLTTSSIIEGVNTSAQKVVLWSTKIGSNGNTIDYFTYRNIAGRAGRMFKYFVGHVYDLVAPPQKEEIQLLLAVSDDCAYRLDDEEAEAALSDTQKDKVKSLFARMVKLVLDDGLLRQKLQNHEITVPVEDFADILQEMKSSTSWPKIACLNDPACKPSKMQSQLYYILQKKLRKHIKVDSIKLTAFIIASLNGWNLSYSDVVSAAAANVKEIVKQPNRDSSFSHQDAFEMERYMTYKLVGLISDFNEAYNLTHPSQVDITPFLTRLSRAYLPGCVYSLEEYALPRYLSKKIQATGLINLEEEGKPISSVIDSFKKVQKEHLKTAIHDLTAFESFVIDNFYDGITSFEE